MTLVCTGLFLQSENPSSQPRYICYNVRMSLITATALAKSFRPEDIFSNITLSVPPHARIAIVGPNGIGKTTLLRILAGEEQPSAGVVSQARSLRTGYLPQEAALESTPTLWDECLLPFAVLRQQEAELARLEAAMGDPDQGPQALERYGRLQAEFEHLGGYTYLNRIEQVLTGLGFQRVEFDFPLAHLSGGQRTRALYARLLLSDPDLLVLDEPTNHLDIDAVEWLEGCLDPCGGAPDRQPRPLLPRPGGDAIWEMADGGMEVYRGNYCPYVQQREERWERRRQVFDEEKARLESDVEYIRKNISGQNVSQARGRLRRLHRYLHAVEQLGLEAAMGKPWGDFAGGQCHRQPDERR